MNIISKLKGEVQPYNWMYEAFESDDEAVRKAHFQKLYDYYQGDKDDVLRSLKASMGIQFSVKTLSKMQFPYILVVRKIIDRISLAYKIPAKRYVNEGDDVYQRVLTNSNINVSAKAWNRLAKLLDTVYVAPKWRDDHIEFDVIPPHLITVKARKDNYLLPETVMYAQSSEDGVEYVYWSAEDEVILDSRGNVKRQNPNPYGLLQYIPCRLREVEDHWGEGDTELVDLNERANILLCSTFHNTIMQSHGQAVAINFGIKNTEELLTGPDVIIHAEKVRADYLKPEFSYVQPQPATVESLKHVDYLFKMMAVSRGLPAANMDITVPERQSGVAKVVDSWEMIENREDDIEALRGFEKMLFNATRAVWNYHNPSNKIPESAVFGIDFDPIKPPMTVAEEIALKQVNYKMGTWTPIDDVMDEDEGIGEEEAKAIINKNLALRKEFGHDAMTTEPQPTNPKQIAADAANA